MNTTRIIYVSLAAALAVGSAGLIWHLYRGGSSAIPGFERLTQPGALSEQHASIGDRCETCHTPNFGVDRSACVTCHATNTNLLSRQTTAFHFNIPNCTGCHVEHRGVPRITAMDHDMLAAAVRKAESDRKEISLVERLTALARRSSENQAERASLDCFSCHSSGNPHHNGSKIQVSGFSSVGSLFGRECASCHSTESWRVPEYRHPASGSTECVQCHQAPPSHYMMHFEMVSKSVSGKEHASVEQCGACHQTDSWNNIKDIGWHKHH